MSRLLSEFPEHTYDQWHAAAVALLKGADFEKRLVSRTYEDITIQPIYRREDIASLPHRLDYPGGGTCVRGSAAGGFLRAGWEVSQELRAGSAEQLNALVHEGFQGGQSELNIVCGSHSGIDMQDVGEMSVALDGVEMDAVSIWWQAGGKALPVARSWWELAGKRGVSPAELHGGFENDPIAEAVRHGGLPVSLSDRLDDMATLTREAAERCPQIRTLCATGDTWHNSGASATQELGYVLATVVAYVEEMKLRGIGPEVSLPRIRIRLAVGSDYFMEIAKIRAARWLWSRIVESYDVTAKAWIHASTSRWNKTAYDAHTNMLRVTSEAFAAVVAGADSLHIGPYDEIAGNSDAFSRRISRNLHTILREECGFDRVIDPAGGSSYIEWLTDQVAAKSWAMFQEIESQGGMIAAIESGSVQREVETVCCERLKNIRQRRDRIVGANMYPDLKGGKLVMKTSCHAGGQSHVYQVPPLPSRRAAEEYEALRDACALYAEKTGAPPQVMQLNMGPSRKYRLRADWTAAFFEVAGFVMDGSRDFDTVDDAVQALVSSEARIAVITSDDACYLELAESLARAVKEARPDLFLLLAGAPGENENAWRAAGVDEFVHIRSNNYELNEQLLKQAGVL